MCSHQYQHKHLLKVIKENKCPYTDFYKNIPLGNLPIDKKGKCIFHSTDIEWKQVNNFLQKLLELISLLKETEDIYNFAEFVFIGEKKIKGENGLLLENLTFDKKIMFDGAVFIHRFELKNIVFKGMADFTYIDTKAPFSVNLCTFLESCDFSYSTFKEIIRIESSTFKNAMLFIDAHCHDTLQMEKITFNHMALFHSTIFEGDYISPSDEPLILFKNIILNGTIDFTEVQFLSIVEFNDIQINNNVNFLDTVFDAKKPTSHLLSATCLFENLIIKEKGAVSFRSTDPKNKMFKNDVDFNFKEEVKGNINFEYVNFTYIYQSARKKLRELEKLGKVNIGKGCFKYLFQSDIKEVNVREGNQSLITEFLETFTNYFSLNDNTSLGIEVVGRTEEIIQFFYFTDEEGITDEEFKEALERIQTTDWINEAITNEMKKYLAEGSTAQDKREVEKIIDKSFYLSKLKSIGTTIGLKIHYGLGTIKDIESIVDVYPNPTEEQHEYVLNGLNALTINYINNNSIGGDLKIGDTQTVNNQGATIETQTNIGESKGTIQL